MKLYYAPGACSFAPHLVLNELEQQFEAFPVNLGTKVYTGGDFTKVNPKGSVPVIETNDGVILTEVAIIMQYLVDQSKNETLLPKSGMNRYKVLEWTNFVATEVHKTLGSIFYAQKTYTDESAKTVVTEKTKEIFARKLKFISESLGTNQYLTGNNFTIADAYLFTCLSWKNFLGLDYSMYSNIEAYLERISQRPSVAKTRAAEKTNN